MARPRFHILVTAPFAALAYHRWGPLGALGLAAGGVLVDLDHLADYLWVRHHKQRRHFLAPLHAWELVAAGGALLLWRHRRRGATRSAPFDAPLAFGAKEAEEEDAEDSASWKGALDDAPRADTGRGSQSGVQALLAGVLAGLVLHLVQDVIANRPRHAGVYALLYRLRHGFDRDRIGWEDHQAFHDWSDKPWYTWI
jgi:hypothetical protein